MTEPRKLPRGCEGDDRTGSVQVRGRVRGVGVGVGGGQLRIRPGLPSQKGMARGMQRRSGCGCCCVPQGRWLTSLIKADSSSVCLRSIISSAPKTQGAGRGSPFLAGQGWPGSPGHPAFVG